MDVYPLNLILAVATASATVFLGFLPTRDVSSAFFKQETLKAAMAWAFIAVTANPKIQHYPIMIGVLCAFSWWHFRRDNALYGKMWLSIASGLGISIGVMLILAVTPRALPAGLSQLHESLLLASIYLGGGMIGLAYVSWILNQNVSLRSGVTTTIVRRYIGLMLPLVLARAAVLLAECIFPESSKASLTLLAPLQASIDFISLQPSFLLLPMALLVGLALFAQSALRTGASMKASYALLALGLVGLLSEMLARLMVL